MKGAVHYPKHGAASRSVPRAGRLSEGSCSRRGIKARYGHAIQRKFDVFRKDGLAPFKKRMSRRFWQCRETWAFQLNSAKGAVIQIVVSPYNYWLHRKNRYR